MVGRGFPSCRPTSIALSAAQPQEALSIANATDRLFGTWLQPLSALVDKVPDNDGPVLSVVPLRSLNPASITAVDGGARWHA